MSVDRMGANDPNDTLREWRESARYWEKHAQTICTMLAPLTRALVEEAGIVQGQSVLDVAGGPEPSLTIAEIVGPTGSVMCTDAVARILLGRIAGIEETRLQQLVNSGQVDQIINAVGGIR